MMIDESVIERNTKLLVEVLNKKVGDIQRVYTYCPYQDGKFRFGSKNYIEFGIKIPTKQEIMETYKYYIANNYIPKNVQPPTTLFIERIKNLDDFMVDIEEIEI